MATAPDPLRHEKAAAVKPNVLRLRLRDDTLDVCLALPLQEAFVVRNVTGGIPVEALVGAFGLDSFAILWWLARRQNGEPHLAYRDFEREWDPTNLTEEDFDLDPIAVEVEPMEDDSPEGVGPA